MCCSTQAVRICSEAVAMQRRHILGFLQAGGADLKKHLALPALHLPVRKTQEEHLAFCLTRGQSCLCVNKEHMPLGERLTLGGSLPSTCCNFPLCTLHLLVYIGLKENMAHCLERWLTEGAPPWAAACPPRPAPAAAA